MQFSQIPLLGGIDELHGHFRVGKRLEQVHWHGGLLSFSFCKCYGEWSMVLVGDAEHRLKAQAHASGSPVLGEGSGALCENRARSSVGRPEISQRDLLKFPSQSIDRRLQLPEMKPFLRAGIRAKSAPEGDQLLSNVKIRFVDALPGRMESIEEFVLGGCVRHSLASRGVCMAIESPQPENQPSGWSLDVL
jgi:hypothetical protein